MNLHKVAHWTRFGVTAVLLNSAAAFGAEITTDKAQLDPGIVRLPLAPAAGRIVGNSSIHDNVIEDLLRDSSMRSSLGDARKDNASAADSSTSMLWPAHKYIPHLSKAVTA